MKNLAEERMKKMERDIKELRDRLNLQPVGELGEDCDQVAYLHIVNHPLPKLVTFFVTYVTDSVMTSRDQVSTENQESVCYGHLNM